MKQIIFLLMVEVMFSSAATAKTTDLSLPFSSSFFSTLSEQRTYHVGPSEVDVEMNTSMWVFVDDIEDEMHRTGPLPAITPPTFSTVVLSVRLGEQGIRLAIPAELFSGLTFHHQ